MGGRQAQHTSPPPSPPPPVLDREEPAADLEMVSDHDDVDEDNLQDMANMDDDDEEAQEEDAGAQGRPPAVTLTPEQETDMMEWIRNKPQFYDKGLNDWLKQKHNLHLWKEKATSLGILDYRRLVRWWRTTRTRYAKLLKKLNRSGRGAIFPHNMTARDKFVWQHGEFLKPHIRAQVNRNPTKGIARQGLAPDNPELPGPAHPQQVADGDPGARVEIREDHAGGVPVAGKILLFLVKKHLKKEAKSGTLLNGFSCIFE